MDEAENEELENWLRRLSEEEMPALANTAQKIADLAEDENSNINDLAEIISQDAAMTANVLRLTNSAYHIPSSKNNTINRALVMLGFNEVRTMCLTVSVLKQMTEKSSHSQLTKLMGRAFHAAVQARSLAIQRGERAPEEVFISALMYNLGEMAFWCFGGEQAEKLGKELEKPGTSTQEASEKILGFSLEELTLGLSAEWGLGSLLEDVIIGDDTDNPRCQAVLLGHKVATAVEEGWGSPEAAAAMQELAEYTGVSVDTLAPTIRENAVEAATTAKDFGAEAASAENCRTHERRHNNFLQQARRRSKRRSGRDLRARPNGSAH